MISALDYLEAAKTEELALQLASQGYKVAREAVGPEGKEKYDLVAERGKEKIVFEVKARARLQQESAQIRHLRKTAHQQGYNEFRLVLVYPPHEIAVEIEGFDMQLLDHLIENMPEELQALSSNTLLKGISDLEFDAVSLSDTGVRVSGTGVVDVALEYDGGEERDGLSVREGYPFEYEVTLNQDRKIETVNRLQVETSSFYE